MYKNWQYLKKRNDLSIRPFWRGFFGVFYCHSLLREIYADHEARSIQQPTFSANGLASGWVALVVAANLIGRSPSVAATLISIIIPSYLCFLPVQNYINSITQQVSPEPKFHKWSFGQIFVLVIGIILWVLILLGLTVEA